MGDPRRASAVMGLECAGRSSGIPPSPGSCDRPGPGHGKAGPQPFPDAGTENPAVELAPNVPGCNAKPVVLGNGIAGPGARDAGGIWPCQSQIFNRKARWRSPVPKSRTGSDGRCCPPISGYHRSPTGRCDIAAARGPSFFPGLAASGLTERNGDPRSLCTDIYRALRHLPGAWAAKKRFGS